MSAYAAIAGTSIRLLTVDTEFSLRSSCLQAVVFDDSVSVEAIWYNPLI